MGTAGTAAEHRGVRTPSAVRRGLVVLAAVVLLAEVAFVAWIIRERGLSDYVALDYRGTRTAGEAILEHGLGAPYDPALLEASQRRLYGRYVRDAGSGTLPFDIVPAPCPPPFPPSPSPASGGCSAAWQLRWPQCWPRHSCWRMDG